MTEKEPEMVPFSFMEVVSFEIELYFAAKCINLVENKADYVARHYKFSSCLNVCAQIVFISTKMKRIGL